MIFVQSKLLRKFDWMFWPVKCFQILSHHYLESAHFFKIFPDSRVGFTNNLLNVAQGATFRSNHSEMKIALYVSDIIVR